MLRFLFIRVQIEGYENFDHKKTYLFVANHVNLFDGFILFGYIPQTVCGVELEDHFHWPFYGWIIRRLGIIPISHSDPRRAWESLEKAKQTIDQGMSVLILPEGHRTLNGQLGSFRRGAFLLAQKAGADIVPMALVGAFAVNRKGSLLIRPGKIILRFGKPITHTEIRTLPTAQIAAIVRQRVESLLTQSS